ncbi:MAG: hypothetical protein O9277_02260 [Magnetospirillum sp.]|nr:hypothetical protein [Magnetospirillum sp.]
MANALPPLPPETPGAEPAHEPTAHAVGATAPFEMDAGYDPVLKREVRFHLPGAFALAKDEVELFSRLFGDIVDRVLSAKEPPQ